MNEGLDTFLTPFSLQSSINQGRVQTPEEEESIQVGPRDGQRGQVSSSAEPGSNG